MCYIFNNEYGVEDYYVCYDIGDKYDEYVEIQIIDLQNVIFDDVIGYETNLLFIIETLITT